MKRIGFIDGRRVAGWRFQASALPGNGQILDVTDPSAGAVGSVAVQTIKYRPTGDKTGVNYSQAQNIEVFPQGDTYLLHGQSIYFAAPVGTPTIHRYIGLDIFMERLTGAVVSEIAGISIGINNTDPATAAYGCFLRCYAHAARLPAFARIAGEGVTSLFYFQRAVPPLLNAPVGGVNSKKLRITFGDIGDFFIPVYPS
ncbi:hypothetical protein ES703_114191 [subsurface metagenome]